MIPRIWLPPRRMRLALARLGIVLLLLSAPYWGTSSTPTVTDVSLHLGRITRESSFQLLDWELSAIASRLRWPGSSAPAYDSPEAIALVRRYFALGAEQRRVREELERAWAAREEVGREARIGRLQRTLDALRREREESAPAVEQILAEQVGAELAREGFSRQLVQISRHDGFVPLRLEVTPPVWFKITPLPQVLVVAPRDQIRVQASRLVKPGMSLAQIEELEDRVDDLGVSSLVTPIGGFAAYPAMVPGDQGLSATLTTVAHEWVHHYFFVRPLGLRYFGDYRLRSVNEIAADLASQELGRRVFARYYAESSSVLSGGSTSRSLRDPTADLGRPSFGMLMRQVRREAERLLATGDVEGAERYMEEQKAMFAQHGYYVRKLNTAYLSFFGSYSGSANPDEPKLRALRERTGSLKTFLDVVAAVDSAQSFDRVVSAWRAD